MEYVSAVVGDIDARRAPRHEEYHESRLLKPDTCPRTDTDNTIIWITDTTCVVDMDGRRCDSLLTETECDGEVARVLSCCDRDIPCTIFDDYHLLWHDREG